MKRLQRFQYGAKYDFRMSVYASKRKMKRRKQAIEVAANFSENVRYLLWREDTAKGGAIRRDDWPRRVATWLGGDVAAAGALLRGMRYPQSEELERVSRAAKIDVEDLLYRNLLQEHGVNIVRENLATLMFRLGSGKKAQLASHLGIHPSTLSRWLRGTHTPEVKTLRAVSAYFRLPVDAELQSDALFLSLYPVSDFERRAWAERRIRDLDHGTLAELFPALAKLLA